MQLESARIFLKPISLADVQPSYVAWLNDEEVTRGLHQAAVPYTIEMLEKYVAAVLFDGNSAMFMIVEKSSKQAIGTIKLGNISHANKNAELGIMIGDKNFWNQGLGKEACNLLLEYAFIKLNLHKVFLAVHANNAAAIKLYADLGFENEGIFKEHIQYKNEYLDKLFMAVFKSTWSVKR